jgi:hypothetical protein
MTSTARLHTDWLRLIDTSGPFLSVPVLIKAFPQGLDTVDSEKRRLLRRVLSEWDAVRSRPSGRQVQKSWIRWVLTHLLELPEAQLLEGPAIPPTLTVRVPEHGETLRPDIILTEPGADGAPRLLVAIYDAGVRLDRPLPKARWNASPVARMIELLRNTGHPLGLVTNGEAWTLVYAPAGEMTTEATWDASLWIEEDAILRAFYSLDVLRVL